MNLTKLGNGSMFALYSTISFLKKQWKQDYSRVSGAIAKNRFLCPNHVLMEGAILNAVHLILCCVSGQSN